jgi:hypothetical protein
MTLINMLVPELDNIYHFIAGTGGIVCPGNYVKKPVI